MKYMLMDYVNEAGWPELSAEDKERWLGVYRAYVEAMARAGVLKGSGGLMPTSAATTVRVVDGKTQVLDGPYADSKEQLAGYHIVEVPDLDAAIAWAARCPTAPRRRRGPPVPAVLGRPRPAEVHRQPPESPGPVTIDSNELRT